MQNIPPEYFVSTTVVHIDFLTTDLNCKIFLLFQGLASESLLYSKLIGVVKEVGAELGQCAQGDEISRERLFTSKHN